MPPETGVSSFSAVQYLSLRPTLPMPTTTTHDNIHPFVLHTYSHVVYITVWVCVDGGVWIQQRSSYSKWTDTFSPCPEPETGLAGGFNVLARLPCCLVHLLLASGVGATRAEESIMHDAYHLSHPHVRGSASPLSVLYCTSFCSLPHCRSYPLGVYDSSDGRTASGSHHPVSREAPSALGCCLLCVPAGGCIL